MTKIFVVTLKEYASILIQHQQMEDFYNKNHNQEHFILYKGKIYLKGNGEGKYRNYLCNFRRAQKEAQEFLLR